MQIDPRLADIDDCLYRVAARVLVMQDNKVLLIKEASDDWWGLPGGGVEHGETVASTLKRELEEELGVPPEGISSDLEIVYYNIGKVVHAVPRMNLFFKATIPEGSVKQTDEVASWAWFSKDEFLHADLHASFDKERLADIIFD